jgi:acetyl esterase/lipase
MVRSHAVAWHIDPKRIGVLGFSAGGHLAALVSNDYQTRSYSLFDDADRASCRPDFAILIYPAYLTKDDRASLAPELKLSSQTPPTFLVQTEDDPVHVENSLVYYRALKEAKVPAEMHLFSSGGHGYGLRPSAEAVSGWPALAEAWLRTRGLR